MVTQFLPKDGVGLDPITTTWLRGLIATRLELQIRGMCWHIEHDETATVATGYVTVTLLHEAEDIRRSWADALGLTAVVDDQGRTTGYTGSAGHLTINLPDAIDPCGHCLVCNRPFDPRDAAPDGRARYEGGDICRSCVVTASDAE